MQKNYINGPIIREKIFDDGGQVLNCSISGEKIDEFAEKLKSIIGADGWARFTIAKSREPKFSKKDPSKIVSTHYIYEDDRKQNQNGGTANQFAKAGFDIRQAAQPAPQTQSDDVPF